MASTIHHQRPPLSVHYAALAKPPPEIAHAFRRRVDQAAVAVPGRPLDAINDDYILQVQTALLVAERKWCDFISYSNGMHMTTVRVWPNPTIQDAIVNAATVFEQKVAEKIAKYRAALASSARLIPTERRIIQEMHL